MNAPWTVVIADDHAVVRLGVRTLLATAQEFTVVGEAVDGEMAVDMVRTLRPDILVLGREGCRPEGGCDRRLARRTTDHRGGPLLGRRKASGEPGAGDTSLMADSGQPPNTFGLTAREFDMVRRRGGLLEQGDRPEPFDFRRNGQAAPDERLRQDRRVIAPGTRDVRRASPADCVRGVA